MTKGIYTYYDVEKNKVIYVGQDSHIDKHIRHNQHIAKCNYNAQPFNRALQNNPDRYHYSVLKEGNYDNDTLNAMEIYYIDIYNTYHYDNPDGLNFTLGGDGNNGRKWTKEQKDKVSKANSGENHWNYGRTESEESKAKRSKNLINKLPIIRKNNKQNKWIGYPRYKDNNKYKTTTIGRNSLTDCITKINEFLNSERNNLGLIMPIIEIEIEEDL